jgi:hypothetical protein
VRAKNAPTSRDMGRPKKIMTNAFCDAVHSNILSHAEVGAGRARTTNILLTAKKKPQ